MGRTRGAGPPWADPSGRCLPPHRVAGLARFSRLYDQEGRTFKGGLSCKGGSRIAFQTRELLALAVVASSAVGAFELRRGTFDSESPAAKPDAGAAPASTAASARGRVSNRTNLPEPSN